MSRLVQVSEAAWVDPRAVIAVWSNGEKSTGIKFRASDALYVQSSVAQVIHALGQEL